MFGKTKYGKVSRRVEEAAMQNPFFPQIALRRRSNEHPMIMFAALAGIGLGSMALIPTAGPALVSAERAPVKIAETLKNTGKGPRLQPLTDTDVACYGQVWGSESEECLLNIARDSGRDGRSIRMIASAEPDTQRPNLF
ncbi:MAG: hypothetical protein M9955_03595 [Rhizobiaceae bacterium]|jgi:hypothetical protein|nr:hypothetical protein [Rhizobiaceae bacterium]